MILSDFITLNYLGNRYKGVNGREEQATLCYLEAIIQSKGKDSVAWNNLGVLIDNGATIDVNPLEEYIPKLKYVIECREKTTLCYLEAIIQSEGKYSLAWSNLGEIIEAGSNIDLEPLEKYDPEFEHCSGFPIKLACLCYRQGIIKSHGDHFYSWGNLQRITSSRYDVPVGLSVLKKNIPNVDSDKKSKIAAGSFYVQAISGRKGRVSMWWHCLGMLLSQEENIDNVFRSIFSEISMLIPSYHLTNATHGQQAAFCFEKVILQERGNAPEAWFQLGLCILKGARLQLNCFEGMTVRSLEENKHKLAEACFQQAVLRGKDRSAYASTVKQANEQLASLQKIFQREQERKRPVVPPLPPSSTQVTRKRKKSSSSSTTKAQATGPLPAKQRKKRRKMSHQVEPDVKNFITKLVDYKFHLINDDRGSVNCARCAFAFNKIIDEGSTDGVKLPVRKSNANFIPKLKHKKNGKIESSRWDDPRALKLWMDKQTDCGMEDLTHETEEKSSPKIIIFDEQTKKDEVRKAMQISIAGEDGEAKLIEYLQQMPRRNKDGTSMGFNLLALNTSNNKFKGHMTNWYVSANNDESKRRVYLLDPQTREVHYSDNSGKCFMKVIIDRHGKICSRPSPSNLVDIFNPEWFLLPSKCKEGFKSLIKREAASPNSVRIKQEVGPAPIDPQQLNQYSAHPSSSGHNIYKPTSTINSNNNPYKHLYANNVLRQQSSSMSPFHSGKIASPLYSTPARRSLVDSLILASNHASSRPSAAGANTKRKRTNPEDSHTPINFFSPHKRARCVTVQNTSANQFQNKNRVNDIPPPPPPPRQQQTLNIDLPSLEDDYGKKLTNLK